MEDEVVWRGGCSFFGMSVLCGMVFQWETGLTNIGLRWLRYSARKRFVVRI